MVKEVEFSNTLEVVRNEYTLATNPNIPVILGEVSDEGMTLTIKLSADLPKALKGARKAMLYYANVDFEYNQVEYHELMSADLVRCHRHSPFTEYTVDLKPVTQIPRKIYNVGGTSEIIIEVYTYEANIHPEWHDDQLLSEGENMRLSAPYTIESNQLYKYDKSTDGLYLFVFVDIPTWNNYTEYSNGDVVVRNDDTFLATEYIEAGIDPLQPSVSARWAPATDEDIRLYAEGNTANPPAQSAISYSLISHYAKYGIILPALLKTNFKDFDDDEAYATIHTLQNYRESAKHKLFRGLPYEALRELYDLKVANERLNTTTEIFYNNVKFTL
jgi:hypothetical protein